MTAFAEHAPADMVWWEETPEKPRNEPVERLARAPRAPTLPPGAAAPGAARPVEARADARHGPPSGLFGTRDAHEQRARESRLYHAQRMASLGELTSGICHDFNNLLTTIIGNLSEVVRSGDLSSEAHEMIQDALAAAVDGAAMTRRLGVREPAGRPRAVDLGESVGELGRMLRRVLKRTVKLELDLADDVAAMLDRSQLDSAVMNLVFNAQHALPEGGTVQLSVDRVGPRARVRVEDDGVGMDAETMRRATEVFFTTRGEEGGTGLGLAMVQDFVGRHGGQLEISSAPGQGTCVTLWFPWVADGSPRTTIPGP